MYEKRRFPVREAPDFFAAGKTVPMCQKRTVSGAAVKEEKVATAFFR